MKITTYENKEDWLAARRGKVTGSRLGDVLPGRGGKKKIGFYELIAERLAVVREDGENPMDRGNRLEVEAIERFAKETKKKVNTSLVLWQRDDNQNIAISPDGFIGKKEAVEVKCLASARHVEAYLTKQIPSDYEEQVIQYFIVNDDLETLYFVFYDPSMPTISYFMIEVKREQVQEKVTEYLEYQRTMLAEVQDIVNKLSF